MSSATTEINEKLIPELRRIIIKDLCSELVGKPIWVNDRLLLRLSNAEADALIADGLLVIGGIFIKSTEKLRQQLVDEELLDEVVTRLVEYFVFDHATQSHGLDAISNSLARLKSDFGEDIITGGHPLTETLEMRDVIRLQVHRLTSQGNGIEFDAKYVKIVPENWSHRVLVKEVLLPADASEFITEILIAHSVADELNTIVQDMLVRATDRVKKITEGLLK